MTGSRRSAAARASAGAIFLLALLADVSARGATPMTLVRSFVDDEYHPMYGTLLVEDARPPDGARPEHSELPGPLGFLTRRQASTVARAGEGWLMGVSRDGYHVVHLELHSKPPADDRGQWQEVMETPYRSATGWVGLALLTGGGPKPQLQLGKPGMYAVRVSLRRGGNEGDTWSLRFWPQQSTAELPRWLVRSEPPVRSEGIDRRRYGGLAADLDAAVLWAGRNPATFRLRDLAARLRASPEDVRAALRFATAAGLLSVSGDPDKPDVPLAISWLPEPERPSRPPRPQPYAGPVIDSASRYQPPSEPPLPTSVPPGTTFVRFRRTGPPPAPGPFIDPPVGAPPRLGVVGDRGELVLWRDGQPAAVVARQLGRPRQAMESASGIVLFGPDGKVTLARPDGRLESLASEGVSGGHISEDGRVIAFSQSHFGRQPWSRVHAIDLSNGARRTFQRDGDPLARVTAVHQGAVYISVSENRPGGSTQVLRWVAGMDPQPAETRIQQIDPVSGAVLASTSPTELFLLKADGTRQPVRRPPDFSAVFISPGGRELHAFGPWPPKVAFFAPGSRPEPARVYALPAGTRTAQSGAREVWEDERHLLFVLNPPSRDLKTAVVRLDSQTGELQRVPLPPEIGLDPVLIQPLLRRR